MYGQNLSVCIHFFTERVKTRAQLQNGRTLHRPLILLHPAAEYGTSTTKTSQISPAYVIVATSTTGLRAQYAL